MKEDWHHHLDTQAVVPCATDAAAQSVLREALADIASLATWHECATAEPQVRQTKADLSNVLDWAIKRARLALGYAEGR